ncbi:heme utilization cystosolic carrier protein HutX [Neiella marina]|uniref:Heme utilization cystosolic carrier protein HutX n=1 Tax=Neiella holothuriorum TaxID=2870530 RepID=A0ABS7EH98_9GAMM|nr:heme utilization cystosolic carrier protein HutX [Neiella holothuriorum]MBW8191585.1 heme utilization cystosolic carrier protein HutX [Neiella holothuriorum]
MTEENVSAEQQVVLPGEQAQALMAELATWRNTTTIVIVAGCVFEFKGVFPVGSIAEGYYNLALGEMGFSGHIKLQAIAGVRLLARQHRGMDSYAFIFEDRKGQPIFKVYLGRDAEHSIHPEQLEKFNNIKTNGFTPNN